MPIEHRLNIAVGILLSLMLAGVFALTLASAGPRIADEADNAVALSKSLIEASVAALQQSRDPEGGLAELQAKLSTMRHVNATLVSDPDPNAAGQHAVPVVIQGRPYGAFLLVPQNSDEIAEIWDEMGHVVTGGMALLVASLACTTWIVRRAMAPVGTLVQAIGRLGEGQYEIKLAQPDAPELAAIAGGVERLAEDLRATRDQNRKLTRKLITVQDDERRDLARELHDEIGPHLFAVRAMGTTLKRTLDKDAPDIDAARKLSETILSEVEILQHSNRRVLQHLAPVGLAELGLEGALAAMVKQRREQHRDIEISISMNERELSVLDDAERLTAYRIVQEGLTNALRHSGGTRVEIELLVTSTEAERRLIAAVRDNGTGSRDGLRSGMGLTGMRERIEALDGTLEIAQRDQGGLSLRAELPIRASGAPSI